MKRWERWSFNALNVAVAITGIAYFYMKYLLSSDDPFAVVNHAWQSSMLSLHVVFAPCLVLFFGIVLRSHILKRLMMNQNADRRTGWLSLLSFTSMALSGYLLQVVSSMAWVNTLLVLHIVTSVVFLIGYSSHLVIGWYLLKITDTASTPEATLSTTARLSL